MAVEPQLLVWAPISVVPFACRLCSAAFLATSPLAGLRRSRVTSLLVDGQEILRDAADRSHHKIRQGFALAVGNNGGR